MRAAARLELTMQEYFNGPGIRPLTRPIFTRTLVSDAEESNFVLPMRNGFIQHSWEMVRSAVLASVLSLFR